MVTDLATQAASVKDWLRLERDKMPKDIHPFGELANLPDAC